jgi:hypothetical protein
VFPFGYPKAHVKRGAKYLARGFTMGSLGPAAGVFTLQRTNVQFTGRAGNKQAKNKNLSASNR